MINDEKNKNMKNKFIVSAFTVWQMIETKLTFSQYLKKLNLHEKTLPIPKEVIDKIDKENIELSKKIMKADKKRKL